MQSDFRKTDQPSAVLIGLDSLQGVQAARILAERRVPVIAIARDPKHYGCRTRVCEKILFADTDEELIRTLEALGPELNHKAVLFPCLDGSVLLVSRERERLHHWYHIVLPSHDVVEMMIDKVTFYTYAQREALPIPDTHILHDRSEALRTAQAVTYPCIMKPTSRVGAWGNHTTLKAFLVSDAEELLALYDRYHEWTDALIVQAWVHGEDTDHFCCNCYFSAKGEPLVTFVTRKIRQWPPETGQGCLGQEWQDDRVLEETLRLYRNVNYHGLGYLEMKRDSRTGEYFIIEPNIGRPTGRSAMAEGSGVDLLYTMYCDAIGWPLPDGREQKYRGTKWIYLRQDVQSVLYRWRHGKLTSRELWQSWRGPKRYALLSWRDPAPFISDVYRVGRLLFSSRERERRGYQF